MGYGYDNSREFDGAASGAVANATTHERVEFIRKTYLHLAGAIFLFAALCAVLTPILGPLMLKAMAASRFAWLGFMAGFVGLGWVGQRLARSEASQGMQYGGLGITVFGEAVMFAPMLFIALNFAPPEANILLTSGLLTFVTFGGLTISVFATKKDFSFLRQALIVAGFVAMGLVVASILFGFNLGMVFSAAMILIAAGYILYSTSNVLLHYPTHAYVAASLELFAAFALLFWYILRLVMEFSRRRD